MNICVIPARGGSKRIPRKNIRDFCGKPMIAYAIEAAKISGLFEHIIVSTDDAEVEETSRQAGAETPFVRPPNLADDFTPTAPVIAHAIEQMENMGWKFDQVCCIYPAVPLIQASFISAALRLLEGNFAHYSFPVARFPAAPQRALRRTENGAVRPIWAENELTRSQDLEPSYYDVGQFYWASTSTWKKMQNIHANGIGLVLPRALAVDIDTLEDWQFAEMLFEVWRNNGSRIQI